MNADELRALQAPIKERYRTDPQAALFTVCAEGRLGDGVTCRIDSGKGRVTAGLHPVAGGSGLESCSGDMLMEALVACAAVTMKAEPIALNIELRDASVRAEGTIDSRGTLGIAKDARVGFQDIRLAFALDTDASAEQVATLVKLT
jgi:uncharacterized OsmC-like protein